MHFKLYFAPGACSFVPHVLLEMAGAAYEPSMVKLHKGEQQSPAYLALNPRGQVPVLVLNPDTAQQAVVTQIVAICNLISELFPQHHFLPTDAAAKAQVMSTLAWMNNTVHPTFTHVFMPHKFTDQPEAQAELKRYNALQYATLLAELEALVQAKNTRSDAWLNGTHFGAIDAYSLTLTRWGGLAGIDPTQFVALWAHVNTVATQPAVARVIERERLQLNLYKA